MKGFTAIARNDLARARVLAESYAAHHHGDRIFVLVTDDLCNEVTGEPFDVIRPRDLPLEAAEFDRMAAIYDAKELITAVKFWTFPLLLEEDESVLFLDSDVEVFAPLDDLGELS